MKVNEAECCTHVWGMKVNEADLTFCLLFGCQLHSQKCFPLTPWLFSSPSRFWGNEFHFVIPNVSHTRESHRHSATSCGAWLATIRYSGPFTSAPRHASGSHVARPLCATVPICVVSVLQFSIFVWKLVDFETYLALLCQTHSAVTCGNFVTGTSLECTFFLDLVNPFFLESMRLVTVQQISWTRVWTMIPAGSSSSSSHSSSSSSNSNRSSRLVVDWSYRVVVCSGRI